MAIKHSTRFACVFFLTMAAVHAGEVSFTFQPTLSIESGQTTEGLHVSVSGTVEAVTLTVEAEAQGKPLPTITGQPEGDTGFLAAPIRDTTSYRVRKLTVEIRGRRWVFECPESGQVYRLLLKR